MQTMRPFNSGIDGKVLTENLGSKLSCSKSLNKAPAKGLAQLIYNLRLKFADSAAGGGAHAVTGLKIAQACRFRQSTAGSDDFIYCDGVSMGLWAERMGVGSTECDDVSIADGAVDQEVHVRFVRPFIASADSPLSKLAQVMRAREIFGNFALDIKFTDADVEIVDADIDISASYVDHWADGQLVLIRDYPQSVLNFETEELYPYFVILKNAVLGGGMDLNASEYDYSVDGEKVYKGETGLDTSVHNGVGDVIIDRLMGASPDWLGTQDIVLLENNPTDKLTKLALGKRGVAIAPDTGTLTSVDLCVATVLERNRVARHPELFGEGKVSTYFKVPGVDSTGDAARRLAQNTPAMKRVEIKLLPEADALANGGDIATFRALKNAL